ncbi:MAG TPA: chemotaxis protein CheB [Polyangiaceae bacterium]|nr:chemotaxis protein CheB [Polyangiaceae bacterium]
MLKAPRATPRRGPPAAVVVGASAGAIEALLTVLPALPAGFPAPLVVVVHLPAAAPSRLAEIFAPRCQLRTREAEDKLEPEPGTVYFAPPDYHLLIEPDGRLSLSVDDPVNFSRPSIDVLFESAAEAHGPALVGALLSGANHDGARGLAAVRRAGGLAIVQDPSTARATAMPQSGLRSVPDALVLPLEGIARALAELGGAALS